LLSAFIEVLHYDQHSGEQAIANGEADLICYGVPFIANPDLVERFRTGSALNTPDQLTFYTDGVAGYTDYSPPSQRLVFWGCGGCAPTKGLCPLTPFKLCIFLWWEGSILIYLIYKFAE